MGSVVIIESHDIVRFGVESLVLACPGARLVGSADKLAEGLRLVAEHAPSVVITEMALADSNGLDTVRAVVAAQGPRATLVLTAQDELLYGEQALALGAAGYVMKDGAQSDLVPALGAVLQGRRWISPALNAVLLQRVLHGRRPAGASSRATLTARELQVLEQLKTGKSTKQIAAGLGISGRTVDLYRAHIKKKLGLRTGAELIAFASHHL